VTTSPTRGPQPTRTERPGAAALRVLRVLAGSAAPSTLATLAGTLGGHPNTTRSQLDNLVADGWATQSDEPPAGRGRPARVYCATVAGRQVALEDPDRSDQVALLEAVVEHLAASADPRGAAREIGRGWGRRLASGERADLTGVLARQGFTPEPSVDGIALRTCPLLASARRWPEVVCVIHQGLVDEVATEPWIVEPFSLPDGCLVRRRSE
jgi:predicted ArsR family transcriptional regulator